MLEPRIIRFLDMLKKINLNDPFLEVLKEVLSYLKFLREHLCK